MTRLEGRMLSGLDEFMLRLGHVKVICAASCLGGSRHRIEERAALALTRLVIVPQVELACVTNYLLTKRLCNVMTDQNKVKKGKQRLRYPNLLVDLTVTPPRLTVSDKTRSDQIAIWLQDLFLANEAVPSKVGAVTVSARSGSKTGFSHVVDWAEKLGVIGRMYQPLPVGRIVAGLTDLDLESPLDRNPYLWGSERIPLAFVVLGSDRDLFSRFLVKLQEAESPIGKRDVAQIFADTVVAMVQESERSSYLSTRQQFRLVDQLRDLRRAAKRQPDHLGSTSTAWHRASSRVESYVDLGLLQKRQERRAEAFEYRYQPSDALDRAVNTLGEATDFQTWLEEYLVYVLEGQLEDEHLFSTSDILDLLPSVVSMLSSPSPVLPIDSVCLGIVSLLSQEGRYLSLGGARRGIERIVRTYPAVARLSRGTSGERAEYVSLHLGSLNK